MYLRIYCFRNRFLLLLPPIPIPSVSQGSLPGEKIYEKYFFYGLFVICCPSPIPIPGVSQSSLPGEKHLEKNMFLMIFSDFYE